MPREVKEIPANDLRKSLAECAERLEEKFGRPTWRVKDPLDELMVTLLSQNTNDANRDRAYLKLREKLPDWNKVLEADETTIESLIRPAGLSKQKSVRMKAILGWIVERFGSLTLEPLCEMNDDEAIDLLTSQTGIGVKTAAVVLAFAFGRDLCPVDTHVHRIAQRLGWVPEGMSAEKTFHLIRPFMPPGHAASFHLNLLRFGRTICVARTPRCDVCPFRTECKFSRDPY